MPVPPADYETAERQMLDDIREWYRGMVEALLDQRASVLQAIRTGLPVAPRFILMREAEVDAYHDSQRQELERLTMLNLVASAEATITLDYFRRIREKLKDRLSRAYQAWHKKLSANKQLRPDFDEDGILDVLKQTNIMDNNIIGRYRECLHARHWVGHGRRWARPIAVDRLDPDDVHDRASALLRAMPA